MRLEKASYKAIKYACLKFHYAKTVPIILLAYSVFNDKNEWCGIIGFGYGASANMGKPFNLIHGEYLELVRIALNGKQKITGKVLATSIKLVKKEAPTVKLLISYADKGQNHIGIIYQATNWIFIKDIKTSGNEVFYKNKWVHDRGPNTLRKEIRTKLKYRKKSGKLKYIYPLQKSMLPMCKELSKPYQKAINACIA